MYSIQIKKQLLLEFIGKSYKESDKTMLTWEFADGQIHQYSYNDGPTLFIHNILKNVDVSELNGSMIHMYKINTVYKQLSILDEDITIDIPYAETPEGKRMIKMVISDGVNTITYPFGERNGNKIGKSSISLDSVNFGYGIEFDSSIASKVAIATKTVLSDKKKVRMMYKNHNVVFMIGDYGDNLNTNQISINIPKCEVYKEEVAPSVMIFDGDAVAHVLRSFNNDKFEIKVASEPKIAIVKVDEENITTISLLSALQK